MASELAHCHMTVGMSTTMSGSVSVAIISIPTVGCIADSVTIPISSTLVTMMVTMTVPFLLGRVLAVT